MKFSNLSVVACAAEFDIDIVDLASVTLGQVSGGAAESGCHEQSSLLKVRNRALQEGVEESKRGKRAM